MVILFLNMSWNKQNLSKIMFTDRNANALWSFIFWFLHLPSLRFIIFINEEQYKIPLPTANQLILVIDKGFTFARYICRPSLQKRATARFTRSFFSGMPFSCGI